MSTPLWGHPVPLPDFDINAAVHEAIDRVVPKDAQVALVATTDMYGARIAVMKRLAPGWSFEGYLEHRWTGPTKLGAEVVFYH